MSRHPRWALGKRATAAFIGGLLMLLVLLVVSETTIRTMASAAQEVSRAHEIRFHLSQLASALLDVRGGPRGLVLTGQETFLEPYDRGVSRLPTELAALRALTATRPEQQRRLAATEPLIAARVEISRRTIEIYGNEGATAATAEIQAGTGEALLDDIRRRLDELGDEESRNATQRQLESDAAVAATFLALRLGGGVAIAILLAVLWLLHSEARTRRQAEVAVRELNASLEQRVAERTLMLADAVRELEAYSYSVSHDLRAPLRAIDGFSQILLSDHAAELPAGAREHLRRVRNGALQMGQLIEGLLRFSRLSHVPLQKTAVATAAMVQVCLAPFRDEIERRQVTLTVGELPACQGDAGLLPLVWTNLLSNALKYTRKSDPARIEIGCRLGDGTGVVYFVRDNGVGFKMAHADKLFGVFQRLHRADDYEGTGVGLATAQRIVHRHGGRMWAEAEPNQGATFYFTLEPISLTGPDDTRLVDNRPLWIPS